MEVILVFLALNCWASRASASTCGAMDEENVPSSIEFKDLLTNHPLELRTILGMRLYKLFPTYTWDEMHIPEEYNDIQVRYTMVSIKECISDWTFLKNSICVPSYSNLYLFFNHGFLFRIEYRFINDDYFSNPSNDRKKCIDTAPIFDALSRQLQGKITEDRGRKSMMYFDSKTKMTLDGSSFATSLFWTIRGAPGPDSNY